LTALTLILAFSVHAITDNHPLFSIGFIKFALYADFTS